MRLSSATRFLFVSIIVGILIACATGPILQPVDFDLSVPQPLPWTHLDTLPEPIFEFAIVADNTGGERDGVFSMAVDKLNALRPQFVMSVGDLISGYTEDPAILSKQWKTFQGYLRELEPPFFYTAGNHDMSNDVMRKDWNARYGRAYYSFNYRGCHFMVLASEGVGAQEMGEAQVAWAEADLERHKSAKWTFIFMHKPLWDYDANRVAAGVKSGAPQKLTGFERVEAALDGRPRTVFAGHYHKYNLHRRDHRDYFVLATTGGGSSLAGPEKGQFDHITWVRMREDGPEIVNLKLDGIVKKDVVANPYGDEKNYLQRSSIALQPVLFDSDTIPAGTKGDLKLSAANAHPTKPIQIELHWGAGPRGLDIKPRRQTLTLGSGKKHEISIPYEALADVPADSLGKLKVTGSARFPDGPEGLVKKIDYGWKILTADRAQPLPNDFKFDGDIGEWKNLDERALARNAKHNPKNSSLHFALSADEEFVYGAVSIVDNSIVIDDILCLLLDLRTPEARNLQPVIKAPGVVEVVLQPAKTADGIWTAQKKSPIESIIKTTPDGAAGEFRIRHTKANGKPWGNGKNFSFNTVYQDADPGVKGGIRLFFRGADPRQHPIGDTNLWKIYCMK